MPEPITLTATVIATLACQKLIESGASEVGKKFTTAAIEKMDDLRQRIWEKLHGRSPNVDEALKKVESGDQTALATIAKNLDVVMDDDKAFAAQMQAVAQEIEKGKLNDQSTMVQNNYDSSTGFQNNVEGGTAYIGTIHIHKDPSKS